MLISLEKQMKQMNKKGNRYWKEMILSGLELPGQSPIWWGGGGGGGNVTGLGI